jgi:serine phosphatase RsbU (regulator of sigma subunit)
VLLFTDGLIEGRIGAGSDRLGAEGLMGLVRGALGIAPLDLAGASQDGLLDRLIEQVHELNGGDLNDDIAILAVGCS